MSQKDTLRALAIVGAVKVGEKALQTVAAKAIAAKAAAAATSGLAALAPAAGPLAAAAVVALVIANEVRAARAGKAAFAACQERAGEFAAELVAQSGGRARAVNIGELPTPSWEECWRPAWVKDRRPGRASVRVPGGWVRRDVFSDKITGPGSVLAQAAIGRDLRPGEFLVIPYGGLYTLVGKNDRPLSLDANFAGFGAWRALLERGEVADRAQALRLAKAALNLGYQRPEAERDALWNLAAGLGSLAR